jgi:DNA/RNA non-specific endonuclease
MAPARTTRRRRATRRRGTPTLTTVLVALLVIAALWLVARELGVQPKVDVPEVPPLDNLDRGAGGGDNRAAVRELGGRVDYGRVDPKTGQRSGIKATINAAMIKAAEQDRLGSEPDQDIRPAGYDQLPARNRARGHLLGRQLGGSGDVDANLVALVQRRANSPVMRDYETAVANAAEAGETIDYRVVPVYSSATAKGAPVAVRLTAVGNRGFRLDVQIANTPEAPVKRFGKQSVT